MAVFFADARRCHHGGDFFAPGEIMRRLLMCQEIGFLVINFVQEKPTGVVCAAQDIKTDVARFLSSALVIGFGCFDEFIETFGEDLNADADDVHGAPISTNDDESYGEVRVDISDIGHVTLFAKCAEAEQRYVGKTPGEARKDFINTIS